MSNLPSVISDEHLETIQDLAACNYSPEKIAAYFQYNRKTFMKHYYDRSSAIRIAYDTGRLRTEFDIINKQKDLAVSGNITSAQIFLKEKKRIDIENIKNQIFFSDEID